jgi:arylsulfatase
MVNEKAMGPDINPFQEIYYRQFGGSPTPEDIQKMKSENALRLGQKPRKPAAK